MKCLITTSLVLALNLSVSSLFAQTTNPATVKLPPANDSRHNLFLQRIAQNKGAGDVIFLGDSITHQWDDFFTDNHALWQEHFGVFNPVNLGVGGDQTGNILWRISDVEGEGRELVNLNPKVAVLLVGINNINMKGGDNQQIADGIAAIVAELKRQKPGIKILVMGILPSSWRAAPINAIVSALHDGESVFFKDIGSLLADSTGRISKEYSPDGIHLSAAGYDVWSKAIKNDLVVLTGHPEAAITVHPASVTVAEGAAATFNVMTTGKAPLFYQWYCDNVAIGGANGPSYTNRAATMNANGRQFKVTVTNAYGAVTSSMATLTVIVPLTGTVVAAGGSVTNYTQNGTNFTAHIFTNSGTLTVSQGGVVEALVVGGGGGGGCWGGGGGAGGVTIKTGIPVTAQGYTVTVGDGGNGSSSSDGSDGGESSFHDVAAGGGGGGGKGSCPGHPGVNAATVGGSGGGGGKGYSQSAASAGSPAGNGFNTFNRAGGVCPSSAGGSGSGGGGAVAVGYDGGNDGETHTGTAAEGGAGVQSSMSGATTHRDDSGVQREGGPYYAGGGGGAWQRGYDRPHGGLGGGGTGYAENSPGTAGRANTGGGGGGGWSAGGYKGGSGIVIVRYVAGGGTSSTSTYTVAYNGNGETGGSAPASQTQTQNVAVVVSGNSGNLVKANHTFAGWNTAASGNGTDYSAGASYMANADVTLYAKWVSHAPR